MSEQPTIAGVGPTEAVIANEQGGLQSPVPYRFDLLDPEATLALVDAYEGLLLERVGASVGTDVNVELNSLITHALMFLGHHYEVSTPDLPVPTIVEGRSFDSYRYDKLSAPALFGLANVLAVGAAKYAPNNWRKIPIEDHVNHALGHVFAELAGNGQDDHLGHAFCRLHMAMAMALSGGPAPDARINWLSRAYVHSMLALAAKLQPAVNR